MKHLFPLLVFITLISNVQAAPGNALDRINFGDLASEATHNFQPNTAAGDMPIQGVGKYGFTYRLPFGSGSQQVAGSQVLTFTLGCDSNRQNFVSVKLWGGDTPTQMYLSGAPGWYPEMEVSGGPAPFPNRFHYYTFPIPLTWTQGKTSVQLTLFFAAWYDLYFGTGLHYLASGQLARPIYSAFTHTAPMFVPDATDMVGSAPARPGQAVLNTLTLSNAVAIIGTVRSNTFPNYFSSVTNRQILPGTPGAPPECVGLDLFTTVSTWGGATKSPDTWRNQIANTSAGAYTSFPDELLSVLTASYFLPPFTNATGNEVAGLDHYHDTNLLNRIFYCFDGCTYHQDSDGGFAANGSDWTGLCSSPRTNTAYGDAGTTNREPTWWGGGPLQGASTHTLGWAMINLLNDPVAMPIFTNYLNGSFDADFSGTNMLRAYAYERMLYNHVNFFPNNQGGTEAQHLFSMIGMYAAGIALEKLQMIYPNTNYMYPQTNLISYMRQVMGIIPDTLAGMNPSPLTNVNYGITAAGLGEAHGALSCGFDGDPYGAFLPSMTPEIARLSFLDPYATTADQSNFVKQANATINAYDQFIYPQDNVTTDFNGNVVTNKFVMAEENYITYRRYGNPNSESGNFNFNPQFVASDPAGGVTNAYALRSAYLLTQYGLTPSPSIRDLMAYERMMRSLVGVAPTALKPLPGEPGQPDYVFADVQCGAVTFVNNGERVCLNANWHNVEINNGFTGLVPQNVARIHYITTNIDRAVMVCLPNNSATVQSDGNLSGGFNQPWIVRYGDYLIVLNQSNAVCTAKLPAGVGQAKELVSGTFTNLGATVSIAAGKAAVFWLAASNSLSSGAGAPTVATSAAASTNVVTGTSVNLSVLGADNGGEASLTYTWALAGNPPNPVTFSVNGNNMAKNTTATFSAAGIYNFVVVITDASGLSTNSSVTVTVNQTLSSLMALPATITLFSKQTQDFNALALNQFGMPMQTGLPVTWSIFSGIGSIDTNGVYSAPTNSAGSATVRVTSGGFTANANVTVAGPVGIFNGSLDIGAVGVAGLASYNNGTYVVKGSGSDVWNGSDQFRFVAVPISGDCTITARVLSFTNATGGTPAVNAKAGVMIRNTLDTNSATLQTYYAPNNTIRSEYRAVQGSSYCTGTTLNGTTLPYWVRVTRSGNTFTGYMSPDGSTWTQVGTGVGIGMNDTVYAGLFVCAFNNSILTVATFDNVSISDALTTPTNLLAAPGDNQVLLNWTASASASGYHVWRSTVSGGPYTLIGSPVTESFTDTTVINGARYYYAVSAFNYLHETTNSTEISTVPGPIYGWWKFDETSGANAVDSGIGGNNAALQSSASHVSGIISNAVNFNGAANSYVTFPSGFVNALNDCTISCWVNLTSSASWMRVFDFGSGTGTYMFLTPASGSSPSTIRFGITVNSSGGEQQINAPSALPVGGWHHLAVTLSANVGVLYLDGVAVGTNSTMTLKPSSLGATSQNYLGKSQWNDPILNGSVDDLRIYSRALSSLEVKASMAPPVPFNVTATAVSASQINLAWNASYGAASYRVKRATLSGGPYSTIVPALTTTNLNDTGLSAGVTYFYVITATNAVAESANSSEVSARPISLTPPNVTAFATGSQFQINWPVDHTGWRLQVQTNSLTSGIGTNWVTVDLSTNVNQMTAPISTTNGSVFFRLVYP